MQRVLGKSSRNKWQLKIVYFLENFYCHVSLLLMKVLLKKKKRKKVLFKEMGKNKACCWQYMGQKETGTFLYTCLLVEIPLKCFFCPWPTNTYTKTNNANTEQDWVFSEEQSGDCSMYRVPEGVDLSQNPRSTITDLQGNSFS